MYSKSMESFSTFHLSILLMIIFTVKHKINYRNYYGLSKCSKTMWSHVQKRKGGFFFFFPDEKEDVAFSQHQSL